MDPDSTTYAVIGSPAPLVAYIRADLYDRAILGLSTDMHTGETVSVFDPADALRSLTPPGPRNRAERRARR